MSNNNGPQGQSRDHNNGRRDDRRQDRRDSKPQGNSIPMPQWWNSVFKMRLFATAFVVITLYISFSLGEYITLLNVQEMWSTGNFDGIRAFVNQPVGLNVIVPYTIIVIVATMLAIEIRKTLD